MSDDILNRLPAEIRARIVAQRDRELRPGFRVQARRTWDQAAFVTRLVPGLVRARQPMTLARHASKLGGTPYLTDPAQWPRVDGVALAWLGQLHFAEMRPQLSPLPERGLLGMWFDREFWRGRPPIVCRWFPEVDEAAAVELPSDTPPLSWLFETELRFERTQRLPMEVAAGLSELVEDPETQARLFEYLDGIGRQRSSGEQEVLPADGGALEGLAGKAQLAGRRLLYSISYENEAGFQWGTHTFYLHIAAEDLARGALEKVVCDVANS